MVCHIVQNGKERERGERKTLLVIAVTLAMMIAEITYGMLYGSMGLLADGMHMGTHAFALAITYGAYVFSRRERGNSNFAFGTGKVSSLAGFTSALFLLSTALLMFKEAIERLLEPVEIGFNESILVAVIGLAVNVASMLLLGNHGHDHGHGECNHSHEDHNLKAAYLHVLADAVTSVTAIFALLAGKYFGWVWLDPVVAIAGGVLVLQWSVGLLKESGKILLDYDGDSTLRREVQTLVEKSGASIEDLHIWNINANLKGSILSVSGMGQNESHSLKKKVSEELGIGHVTIECL